MKAISIAAAAVAAIAIVGCTVHQTEAPPLSGPSVLAQSVTLTATPDTITQNGAAQSSIGLTVRDASGAPASGQSFRLDIMSDTLPTPSFGTLSSRTVTTGSDGRAAATFTAPPSPPNGANIGTCAPSIFSPSLTGPCVTIVATPIGTGFTTQSSTVDIHLIPNDPLPVAGAPTAFFTMSTTTTIAGAPDPGVLFDASLSTAESGHTIVSYAWNWGDGTPTEFGLKQDHNWFAAGTYFITLTVTDDVGRKASTTKSITVVPR